MKLRIFLFITLLITAVFLFFPSSEESEVVGKISPVISQVKNVFKTSSSIEQSPHSIPKSSQEIEQWVHFEALKMDVKSYDSAFEESILRERAFKLTLEEIQVLKEIALDAASSANERIFSTYLLSLSSSRALTAIQEIASSKLSKPGPQEPHSLDETQSMHEKAIKRMMIDELFKRAMQDTSLIPMLARTIEVIQVPEIKAYAQKRFQELFGENK